MKNHFTKQEIEDMKGRFTPYQRRSKLIKKTPDGKDNKES